MSQQTFEAQSIGAMFVTIMKHDVTAFRFILRYLSIYAELPKYYDAYDAGFANVGQKDLFIVMIHLT